MLMWRKGTLLHCWWEWRLVEPLWKSIWRFLRTVGLEIPFNPAIPLLGISPAKIMKRSCHSDTCAPMFITTQFVIAKSWNNQNAHQPQSRWKRCGSLPSFLKHWRRLRGCVGLTGSCLVTLFQSRELKVHDMSFSVSWLQESLGPSLLPVSSPLSFLNLKRRHRRFCRPDWTTRSDLHSFSGAEGARGDFQHTQRKLWNIAQNLEIKENDKTKDHNAISKLPRKPRNHDQQPYKKI